LITLAASLAVCAWVFRVLRKGRGSYHSAELALSLPWDFHPPGVVAAVAVFCVFLYLWQGAEPLGEHRGLFAPRTWLASFRPLPFLVGGAVLLAGKRLADSLARAPNIYSAHDALVHLGWMSVRKPGLFGVAHVVYFGPILLLACLRWRQVCRRLHPYGLGLTLSVGLHLLLSLDCESRHLIHFFPVVVFGVVKAMEDVPWRGPQYAVFVLLSLAFSKCWLTLGGMPDTDHPNQFPAQLLFMNLGPWMSGLMYFVQGSYVLLAGYLLSLMLPARAQAAASPADLPGSSAAQPAGRLAA
jgi:hypothetical protein